MSPRVAWCSVVLIAICAGSMGCRDEGTTIWSREVQSPNGKWLASAQTKQWSGPGNAYVETSVYLKLIADKQPPVQVLDFPNESDFPGGAVNVEWTSPNHLTVTYRGQPTFNFQAVKCGDVDISVEELPSEKKNPSR